MSLIRVHALRRWLYRVTFGVAAGSFLLAALFFPYDVDQPLSAQQIEANRKYYAEAYKHEAAATAGAASEYEARYIQIAAKAAKHFRIKEMVDEFVSGYGLQNAAVLEIGSGRGYLQDAVENYTGLDISSSVSRFYHKPFVLGSATAMPFPDNSFDGGWSIWVLEHVPNPEQALRECRRVMKNNAVLLLFPAWNVSRYAAEGYDVRPASELDWRGKVIKATLPIRSSVLFQAATLLPVRSIREAGALSGPTTLHYYRLEPNYKDYWGQDADAINGLDRHEVQLWFTSRGDECLNCNGLGGGFFKRYAPLIVRIRK